MSLDTVPKTNWESDDGVQFTQLNEIGANLQVLQDTKVEKDPDTDEATITTLNSTTANITTNNVTTSNITTANITTLNMSGAINPALTVQTSVVVSAGSNWIPARGLYIVSFDGASLTLQINVSGWKGVDATGGAFPTDGSNVRVNNATGGDLTAYYLKF